MSDISWTLQTHKIKNLKDFAKNPRQISKDKFERLGNLISKFGLIDKPIINADFTIIGGHQRIKYLKKQKIKEVECWTPNRQLDEKEIDELCIGLNLHKGDWDWDIMANLWDPIELLGLGFSEKEILGINPDIQQIEENIEEDEITTINEKEAITKPGDLYILGEHRIICGNSSDPDTVKKIIGIHEPILMITDPPYGVNYEPEWRNHIKKSKVKQKDKVLNDDKSDWMLAYHLFPGSVAYVWHSGIYSHIVAKNLVDCDYQIISQIIWNKNQHILSRGDYHWKHEPCWYAVKNGHKHNWNGDRKQSTVWDIKNIKIYDGTIENEKMGHGTQKPIECMSKPIINNSNEGDYVYDPFLGSGTTLIAAEKTKRKCIGIELSPAFCDMIIKRYISYKTKKNEDIKIIKNDEDFDVNLFKNKD